MPQLVAPGPLEAVANQLPEILLAAEDDNAFLKAVCVLRRITCRVAALQLPARGVPSLCYGVQVETLRKLLLFAGAHTGTPPPERPQYRVRNADEWAAALRERNPGIFVEAFPFPAMVRLFEEYCAEFPEEAQALAVDFGSFWLSPSSPASALGVECRAPGERPLFADWHEQWLEVQRVTDSTPTDSASAERFCAQLAPGQPPAEVLRFAELWALFPQWLLADCPEPQRAEKIATLTLPLHEAPRLLTQAHAEFAARFDLPRAQNESTFND